MLLMVEIKSMLTGKHVSAQPPEAKPNKHSRASQEVLQFISENQRMAGFSGQITPATAKHQPNMKLIARSAIRFDAQVPGKVKRSPRPRISKFGDQL
jgi:hypothetical protein